MSDGRLMIVIACSIPREPSIKPETAPTASGDTATRVSFCSAAYPPALSKASRPTASAPRGPAIVPSPGGPRRLSSCSA